MLKTPELNPVLLVKLHRGGIEEENGLPQPADHTSFDEDQAVLGFLGCEYMLLAHMQFFILQAVLLCLALNPLSVQPVFVFLQYLLDIFVGTLANKAKKRNREFPESSVHNVNKL